mgnify:CR=1 FL=1
MTSRKLLLFMAVGLILLVSCGTILAQAGSDWQSYGPRADEIVMVIIRDPEDQRIAFQRGDIHVVPNILSHNIGEFKTIKNSIKTDSIIGGHRRHLPFLHYVMSACYPDRVRFRRISGQYQVHSLNIILAISRLYRLISVSYNHGKRRHKGGMSQCTPKPRKGHTVSF